MSKNNWTHNRREKWVWEIHKPVIVGNTLYLNNDRAYHASLWELFVIITSTKIIVKIIRKLPWNNTYFNSYSLHTLFLFTLHFWLQNVAERLQKIPNRNIRKEKNIIYAVESSTRLLQKWEMIKSIKTSSANVSKNDKIAQKSQVEIRYRDFVRQ